MARKVVVAPAGARRCRRKAVPGPAGFGRHSGPILATLQCGLAMFFVGAAWAKMTEPLDLLSLLMIWPADTSREVVRAVGCIELLLAATVAAPLLREWRGRRAALTAALALSGNAAFMTAYYAAHRDPGMATTNLILLLMSSGVLVGHRSPLSHRPRRPNARFRPTPVAIRPGVGCDPGTSQG